MNSDDWYKEMTKYSQNCKQYLYFSYDPEIYVEPDDWNLSSDLIKSAHEMKLNELFIEYKKDNPWNKLDKWNITTINDKTYVLFHKDSNGIKKIIKIETKNLFTFNDKFSIFMDYDDFNVFDLLVEI
jgi:hypothetical protein